MICHASHHLYIDNLSEGETVNHSILLIRGRVCPPCPAEKCIQVQVQLCTLPAEAEQQQNVNKYVVTSAVARSGEFKLLLDLRRYEQSAETVPLVLRFLYCTASCCTLRILYTPQPRSYKVQPLYIVCTGGGEGQTNTDADAACQLIDLNVRLVQSVYADKIRAAGFGRRTFALNGSCRVFQSQLSCEQAWRCNEDQLWQRFAEELLNSAWGRDACLKFIAFIACTRYNGAAVAASGDYSYANIRRHLQAHAALGGGGLALFGSAHFYAWPRHLNAVVDCFHSNVPVDCAQVPDESNYRRTHGGVYASTLGAVCHELGHIFELGHTSEGVMGSGFDYINRVFTVDNLTEHLPTRVIHKGLLEATASRVPVTRPRFTQLKPANSNSFLQKYHEQKESDGWYFTRNCAVILAHHKWLNESDGIVPVAPNEDIIFERASEKIVSRTQPLRLIELRCNANSLVARYYEFQQRPEEAAVYSFQLPSADVLPLTHHIFVLTTGGQTKRLRFQEPVDGDHEA